MITPFPSIIYGQVKTIAISDLKPQGVSKENVQIISDRLRAELFKQRTYTVLERSQMKEILKEQGFQQSGCVASNCAVEIGQLLGVQSIIIGTVGKVGRMYSINLRVVNVDSGKITATVTVDRNRKINKLITGGVKEAVERLMNELRYYYKSKENSGQLNHSARAIELTKRF